MKSTVNEGKCEKEIEYPCLMNHVSAEFVVLFASHRHGMVISEDTSNVKRLVGFVSNLWVMSAFEPFHGSVTLEN